MRHFSPFFAAILTLTTACNLLQPVSPTSQPLGVPATALPEIVATTSASNEVMTPEAPQATLSPSTTHFLSATWPSMSTPIHTFEASTYQPAGDSLPLALDQLTNAAVTRGLTVQQMDFLRTNGFVILASADQQFSDIRDNVAQIHGQPYYLTTDNAFHALHVTFNDLLAAVEKEALSPIMSKLVSALASKIDEYAAQNQAPILKADLQLAQNYLAVARKLFDPTVTLDTAREQDIAAQMAQIAAMDGKQDSALIPGLTDDYGAYRPVGHYAGDPELEHYFQGMTWLGRVAFPLAAHPEQEIVPSKVPLLITLALREAEVDYVPADQLWSSIYAITDFMIGPSDDPGPLELNTLMEAIYGPQFSLSDLASEDHWQQFLEKVPELPAPQINSTFQDTTLAMSYERDWRLMGQRFTLDGLIFQQLISDKVEKRFFPMGLDIAAAFGSQAATAALEDAGQMDYANYEQQLDATRRLLLNLPTDFWTKRFYNNWLYAFQSQVSNRSDTFPAYMTSQAWGLKEVNSLLGSWTELKHDTILYSKMPEGLGGGGPPTSPPTPSYVEPNPDVFARLAYAARNLQQGLAFYLDDWSNRGWYSSPFDDQPGTQEYMAHLERLADHLDAFSQIAVKELRGESISEDDNYQILSCLELKDCLTSPYYSPDFLKQDPIPLVASVAGYENEVLEAAIGQLNRIYVAVSIQGQLQIAQGGIFTYFEFKQPRSERLTDQAWREKLVSDPPAAPPWYAGLVLAGGSLTTVLAFRIGDVYVLTEAGANPPLNLRAEPSKSAAVIAKLDQDAYLEIIAGPSVEGNDTWWQVKNLNDNQEGWVLENQDWYARSY